MPLLEQAGSIDNPSRIINLGSVMGTQPLADDAYSYPASKAAVHHLTRTLAGEFAGRHVTVNAFAPGVVDTPMWIGLNEDIRAIDNRAADADPMSEFATNTLIGRPATPAELAPFLVYLASGESDYMTGQMYMVDGGQILV